MGTADIVFAPYHFLLDGNIRDASGVKIANAVIVFDEGQLDVLSCKEVFVIISIAPSAHNIEDSARSIASTTIARATLQSVVSQLESLAASGIAAFKSLHHLYRGLLSWLDKMTEALSPEDFANGNNIWKGEEMIAFFESEMSLTPDSLDMYLEHLSTVLKDGEDVSGLMQFDGGGGGGVTASESPSSRISLVYENPNKISSASAFFMKDVMKILRYMLGNDGKNATSFRAVIDQEKALPGRRGVRNLVLHFWCLNPAIVFREIGEQTHCILLARYSFFMMVE